MSYHVGWEAFSPEPGTKDKMYCRVCNMEMNVKRDVNGPTSSMEAMGQRKHLHDSFTCGHAEEDWHIQARILKQKLEKEPCATIADIMTNELECILKHKTATRNLNWKYM
jgi:hypothetical protein